MQTHFERQESQARNRVSRGIHEFQVYKIWRKLNIHYSSNSYNAYHNKKLGGNQLDITYYSEKIREKPFYRALGHRVNSKVDVLKIYVSMVEREQKGYIHISDVDMNRLDELLAECDQLTSNKSHAIVVHDIHIIRKNDNEVWPLLMERRIRLFTASYLWSCQRLSSPDNLVLYSDLYKLVQKHAEHFMSGRVLNNPLFCGRRQL